MHRRGTLAAALAAATVVLLLWVEVIGPFPGDRPIVHWALRHRGHGEVWDLVRSLPTRQRTAVVLRYVGDLREDDIASVMGVTRGTVAATLANARRALATVLDDIEVEEP